MHFLLWRLQNSDSNLTEICSQEYNWQQASIGSGNGLVPKRPQAITWTNADPVHLCIYTALGGNELRIGLKCPTLWDLPSFILSLEDTITWLYASPIYCSRANLAVNPSYLSVGDHEQNTPHPMNIYLGLLWFVLLWLYHCSLILMDSCSFFCTYHPGLYRWHYLGNCMVSTVPVRSYWKLLVKYWIVLSI